MFSSFYQGKKVLVTGHTGFKGAWLCQWLCELGANVAGISLGIPTNPSLFTQLGLAGKMGDNRIDIRNLDSTMQCFLDEKPDIVFHLAAQSLVRESYTSPVDTYSTNVMGTIHVLECLRALEKKVTGIIVTTDKCYENQNWLHGYRESDPMGGHDPYSSSKGCVEILVSSYRRSFFDKESFARVGVATARAGNVLGGGDWATDRIVPDAMRSLSSGDVIRVRNPSSTRPWQHVLEPLSGYLWLGATIGNSLDSGSANQEWKRYTSGFNFGPEVSSNLSVGKLVDEILIHWDGRYEYLPENAEMHEAEKLNLVVEKAFHLIDWRPTWDFKQTIEKVVDWYRDLDGKDRPDEYRKITLMQISDYIESARARNIPWSR